MDGLGHACCDLWFLPPSLENEPLVMSHEHAIDTFQKTRIDVLVLGDYVVRRS
jgi:hypothetical protein